MSNKKLTMAQVFTLRRMATGSKYMALGDGTRAEEYSLIAGGATDRKNAPSIPVLLRLKMVEFLHPEYALEQKKSYNRVMLTDAGRQALIDNGDRQS